MPSPLSCPANNEPLATLQQLLGLVEMTLIFIIITPVLASRPQFLPFDAIAKSTPLTVMAEIATTWSVALTKISIALLLLRLKQTVTWVWKWFLYIVIALLVLTAAFVTVLHTTRCIPTAAVWNPTILNKRCWSPEAFKVTMTVASCLVITTDIIFSLIPLTFLHHIRQSVPHRISIAILMSLGLAASTASVIKTVMVHRFDQGGDASGNGIAIALWSAIEAQVSIIAACIPTLRAAFLRLLDRLGIYTEFPTAGADRGSSCSWRHDGIPGGTILKHSGSRPDNSSGPQTSTKIVASQREVEIRSSLSGQELYPSQDERATEVDIESSSLKCT